MSVTEPLLRVRGLRRSFYGVNAVSGLDLDVAEGTITGLIGPNGAGKTTAFQCITGVIEPDAGSVVFAGRELAGASPDRISRAGLLRTFQIARGISRLSVLDNLLLYAPEQPGESLLAAVLGHGRDAEEAAVERAWTVVRKLNLLRVANNPAGALSGGQKKLLEIGRALMAAPRMIMLDEPMAGVNPSLSLEIADHILGLKEDGITFLMIEHHMEMVGRLCDPVIVMAEGQRLMTGSFREVADNRAVQDAYMGRRRWA
jgi:branched-chain amino acid transport system ATP-binding protein/neutral amino acid transport system ATP-binding protein